MAKGGDQAESIYIQPGLALKALKRWIEVGGITEATPVFRAVAKGGRIGEGRLTRGSIARIVRARCARAGLEPSEFSGHSLAGWYGHERCRSGRALVDQRQHGASQRFGATDGLVAGNFADGIDD